jgi:hypothetical protein
MGTTWIATAIDWGGGEVLLGLADRSRAEALRRLPGEHELSCGTIAMDKDAAPLHCVALQAVRCRVLHRWSDGSREVAVDLPGEPGHSPASGGGLSARFDEGWVILRGLNAEARAAIHSILCSGQRREFSELYLMIRSFASGRTTPGNREAAARKARDEERVDARGVSG